MMSESTFTKEIICIVCPNGCHLHCEQLGDAISCRGQSCNRGLTYAKAELTHPMRSLTTSVRTAFADAPVISVRTNGEIEKNQLLSVSKALGEIVVQTRIKIGDIVAQNICGTGVDIICTSDRLIQKHSA